MIQARVAGRTAVAAFLCACAAACAPGTTHPAGWPSAGEGSWSSGTQRYDVSVKPYDGALKQLAGEYVVNTVMATKATFVGGGPYGPCPGLGMQLTFRQGRGASQRTIEQVMSIRESQATIVTYTRGARSPEDPAAVTAITQTTCRSNG